ncbi:MAG: alpha/beta fold hydrolase, partial [Polyangiaceae bacterium]
LRRDPRWPTVRSFLRKTQRYWAKRPSNTEVVAIPRGYAAGKPIPLVVALHGLGSSPEDFAEGWMQKAADALSVAIVSVSGTEVRGPHSYAWAEDIERDRARIERAVTNLGDRVTVAPGKIVLVGFSQGAQMSAELAARFPDRYAGAIAMSPGTRRELRLKGIAGGSLAGHRFVVLVGEGEHPGNVERARADAEALRAAGGDAYYHAYPELRTHARPPDFEKAFPSWVRFILDGKPL